jgi:hypothetical protein
LAADVGVTRIDSAVSGWADQSGNNNNAVQLDIERRPFFVKDGVNGRPSIRFDGADDRLGLTGSKRMSRISLFVVFKIDSGGPAENFYVPVSFGDEDEDGRWWIVDVHSMYTGNSPDRINILVGYHSVVQAEAPGCARFGQWKIMTVSTADVIGKTALRTNGVDAKITPFASFFPPPEWKHINRYISVPLGNPSGRGVGGIGGADGIDPGTGGRSVAKCDIAELILYDSVLSDSLQRIVERYLSNKYGLPVE